jgi:hypothetical protein
VLKPKFLQGCDAVDGLDELIELFGDRIVVTAIQHGPYGSDMAIFAMNKLFRNAVPGREGAWRVGL